MKLEVYVIIIGIMIEALKLKHLAILLPIVALLTSFGCDKEEESVPIETMIQLKSAPGLSDGTTVNFLALSKTTDFRDLYDPIHYSRYDADWYIDGGVAPFTTSYKKFTLNVGTCYYLLQCPDFSKASTITIDEGKNTIQIDQGSIFR